MKKKLFTLIMMLISFSIQIIAQNNEYKDSPFANYILRQKAFGERIPQEKVYVHMDNTCYFIGDTIWFKAYTRQTNTNTPSKISGTLYAELLNHEGYLVERKIIEMKNGEGHGFFYLGKDTTMYSGMYELRAYTRWQLNWGAYEHPHTKKSENWFFNKAMAHQFFRDYEKLYSRVFPVYDAPTVPGAYYASITERVKDRAGYSMPMAEVTKLEINFYPEGGDLLAGVPCRVAFEAKADNGHPLEGELMIDGKTYSTKERGRGIFTLTPEADRPLTAKFIVKGGTTIEKELPKPVTDGAALTLEQDNGEYRIRVQAKGIAANDSLCISIMHQGVLVMAVPVLQVPSSINVSKDKLPVGVNQITLFNSQGRVYADRLFFVQGKNLSTPSVTFNGIQQEYKPYEKISLEIASTGKANERISVSVKDKNTHHGNFDDGNMMTEMLLSSEIRGFVPQPGWYFEKDDTTRIQALDLLMMTQGWRRYKWNEMAVRGEFELIHPAEQTPVITGSVHTYDALIKYDPLMANNLIEHYTFMQKGTAGDNQSTNERFAGHGTHNMKKSNNPQRKIDEMAQTKDIRESVNLKFGRDEGRGSRKSKGKDLKKYNWGDSIGASEALRERLLIDGENLKREVLVHALFSEEGVINGVVGETTTRKGVFNIKMPHFYGACHFHLAASDTTKWTKEQRKTKSFAWIASSETDYPEFYVRLHFPYPKFVRPFNYYQIAMKTPFPLEDKEEDSSINTTLMETVSVKGKKRRGSLQRKYQKPAACLDAYEVFNTVVDAGLMDAWFSSTPDLAAAVARYLVKDMGIDERYNVGTQYGNELDEDAGLFQIDGKNPDIAIQEYNMLCYLDSVLVYTGYSPRLEGHDMYKGDNIPHVRVQFKRIPEQAKRRTYRDRFMNLQGYSSPAEFYSPDYSKQTPPDSVKDYRRTLYWNPNLMLDKDGKATVTLYNNARTTQISVDAAGQAADGTLLWGRDPL